MKIDYHCHILPGIDDGAASIEESMLMTRALKDWGFDRVYCTPHITTKFKNTPESIRPAFELLKEAVNTAGIDIDLRMSAECRLVPETWPQVLEQNWLMPIEDKYILMEFPISKPYKIGNIKPMEEFQKILSMGLTPMLAHPERYLYLTDNDLMSYLEVGVKFQSNYGSLAGLYGEQVRQNVLKLKDQGMISFYGTDLHNTNNVGALTNYF